MKTCKRRKQLSQNAVELMTAICFSIVLILMSLTNDAYHPLNEFFVVDLVIIPAIFAAMIGGPRIIIPVSVMWTGIAFYQRYVQEAPSDIDSIYVIVCIRILFLLAVWWTYQWARRRFEGSPHNVYWGIAGGIFFKFLLMLPVVWYYGQLTIGQVGIGIRSSLIQFGLTSFAMFMIVERLRKVHVLNGIRRKERKRT